MSDEEIAEYALELRELKVNSKPIITSLTMLAGEIGGSNPAAADAIAGVVEKRIRTSEPKLKLTALYLLDSIAKNIGGHYVARFAAKLPETFLAAHVVADEPTRKSMARLFHTWRPIFAQATLAQIEAGLPPNALAFAAKLGAPPPAAPPPGPRPPPPPRVGSFGALPPPKPPPPQPNVGSYLASTVLGGGDVSALLSSIAAAKARASSPAPGGGSPSASGGAPAAPPPPPKAPPGRPSGLSVADPSGGRDSPSVVSGGAGGSGSGGASAPLTGPDPLGAEFDPERDDVRELRRRREKTVEALYGELKHQCAQSGRRFATRAELDAHLDVMHMRARRRKEGNASRRWCVDADQWVAGAAAEAADDAPAFFAAEEAAEEEREAAATASLPVDEDQPACALSGEPFETFWNAEEEEWHYRGATRLTRAVGSVPAGAYVLYTAVPKGDGEGMLAAVAEDRAVDEDLAAAAEGAEAVEPEASEEKASERRKRKKTDEEEDEKEETGGRLRRRATRRG